MRVGQRDASWFAYPSKGGGKYHALGERGYPLGYGPLCSGIPHDEDSEIHADKIDVGQRCGRSGCKAAFKEFDEHQAIVSRIEGAPTND